MLTKVFKNSRLLTRTFSKWDHLPVAEPDPILSLNARYVAEEDPRKVNLTIGAYRDEKGNPWILPSVKAAMEQVNQNIEKLEYLPPLGDAEFNNLAWKCAYGEDSAAWNEGRIGGIQTLSGTGGVYIALNFIKQWWRGNNTQLYTTTPTWPIHDTIAIRSGFDPVKIPYFDPATNGLDWDGFATAIDEAPRESVILLHACAHNPTGVDPNPEQWNLLADIIERKGHLAFFDMAYQGFASGDLRKDAAAIELWQKRGLPFVLAQSFAKSMGLYGLRTGAFSVITDNQEEANKVTDQLGFLARQTWSSPPLYGAAIAKALIGNPELYELWSQDMITMSGRIIKMRQKLKQNLIASGKSSTKFSKPPNNSSRKHSQLGPPHRPDRDVRLHRS